jgi:hypothetical protein
MKTKTLILTAASGLLLAAAALLTIPAESAAPAESLPRAKLAKRSPQAPAAGDPRSEGPTDPQDPEEAVHLAAWRDRLAALEAETGDREQAVRTLLEEIDATYRLWVEGELGPLAGLTPAERYDPLAEIQQAMTEGTTAILDQLGLEESRRLSATASPAEALAAETQYAEAAGDSAARLALLRLDRERQVRLEQALAIADEAARNQAVAELDAWYDTGLGGIFTPAEP